MERRRPPRPDPSTSQLVHASASRGNRHCANCNAWPEATWIHGQLTRVELQHSGTRPCLGKREPLAIADWLGAYQPTPTRDPRQEPRQPAPAHPRRDQDTRRRERHRR